MQGTQSVSDQLREHDTPLVSVVMPSFGQAAYIEESILSVLNQDYPRIELLIIDGGSTDGTVDIIRRHASRIAYWVSEKDGGQADAINKGWSRCQGDIVTFLNSDDTYIPGAVSRIVAAFTNNPSAGVVYGQARWVEQDGRPALETNTRLTPQEMLDGFRSLPQPAAFLRREAIERVGRLDPTFHYALDGEFFMRVLGNFEAVALPQVLATMRLHPASKSVATGTGFAPEILRIAEKVISSPTQYPLYHVDPVVVRAGAKVAAARFLFMNGEYVEALGALRAAAMATPRYRYQIVSHELPRFLARAVAGPRLYAWAAALRQRRLS